MESSDNMPILEELVTATENDIISENSSPGWNYEEELWFLQKVKKWGKGKWKNFLDDAHEKHHLTFIEDYRKLPKKYNDLVDKKKGKLSKPFHTVQFRLPKGTNKKDISNEEYIRRERLHAVQQQKNEQQFNEMVKLVNEIEEREKMLPSNEKLNEDEIRKYMNEKGNERKALRLKRLQDAEDLQQEERKLRKINIEALETLKEEHTEIKETNKQLLTLLEKIVDKMSSIQ